MIQESQFPRRAHETIKGLRKGEGRPDVLSRKYFRQAHGTTVPVCRNIIMGFHNCEMFREMDIPCRWDVKKVAEVVIFMIKCMPPENFSVDGVESML